MSAVEDNPNPRIARMTLEMMEATGWSHQKVEAFLSELFQLVPVCPSVVNEIQLETLDQVVEGVAKAGVRMLTHRDAQVVFRQSTTAHEVAKMMAEGYNTLARGIRAGVREDGKHHQMFATNRITPREGYLECIADPPVSPKRVDKNQWASALRRPAVPAAFRDLE